MKIATIIQARMGSTRLPGKVLLKLGNYSVLQHMIERVKKSQLVNQIIIATTTEKDDEVIADEAKRIGVPYYRGSESNVLERYYFAAKTYHVDHIIRLTADCPFIDIVLLDHMLKTYLSLLNDKNPLDYLSNCLERSYPRGFDIEIFSYHALTKAYQEAEHDYEFEHVTPYIYHHPNQFHLKNMRNDQDQSSYRLTLDTIEDWNLIQEIYQRLERQNLSLSSENILGLLKAQPSLLEMNNHIKQKEFNMLIRSKDENQI